MCNFKHGNYTLNIVSKHPEFNNATLKKFNVEGIETIGVWGDEVFEIVFYNNNTCKVQTKISIDGVDVLTGELANTSVKGQMWLVEPYSTLRVKAWQETTKGGASLVFTNTNNSVSLNVHNSVSHRGIISAAVFTESSAYCRCSKPHYENRLKPLSFRNLDLKGCSKGCSSGPTKSCNRTYESFDSTLDYSLSDSFSEISDADVSNQSTIGASAASVGAGSYINNNIHYAEGFIKPQLSEIVKVRYLWWDDLKAKLETQNFDHPSGFPGDEEFKHVDLKNTPRLNTNFDRFNK